MKDNSESFRESKIDKVMSRCGWTIKQTVRAGLVENSRSGTGILHRMRPISVIVVKQPLRKLIVPLSILAMLIATQGAEAGPFVDFFRALRRSITHPEQKPRSHRSTRKQNKDAVSSDASNSQTSGGAVAAPPNRHNVRAAKAAPATKEGKNGLLYGTPVPGKQGLVTSPFAPDSGYIDVSGFPPGTEVKDPYTGKIFLTP